MSNYYEILGLSSSAGSLEIKNAFRRLAKLYHPDKNPNGKEQFNRILKAYEILSDPIQKSTYDYRIKHVSTTAQDYDSKNTSTKNWRFDEKELKRRQYYNDFIKKQTKEAEGFDAVPPEKRAYNDYKYIFFATPLAVILFLLIMKLATPHKSMPVDENKGISQNPQTNSPVVYETGASVFDDLFGSAQYNSLQRTHVNIKNETNFNVLVCLFSGERFLRSVFIKRHDGFDVENLPGKTFELKYCDQLDSVRKKESIRLSDAMPGCTRFYKSLGLHKLKTTTNLFLKTNHEGFVEITKKEFFP